MLTDTCLCCLYRRCAIRAKISLASHIRARDQSTIAMSGTSGATPMATVPIVAIAAAAPAVAIAAAAPDVPVASAAPDVPVAAAAPDVPVAAAAPDVPVADATASTGVHQPMEGKEQTHMEKLFAMHEVRMLLDTALRMKLVDEKGIDTIMEDMHSGRFTTQHYDTMWRSLINAASIKPVIPSTTFTPPVPVPVPALVPIEAPSAVGLPGAGDGSLVRQAPVKAPSAEAPPGFRPIISDRQTTRQLVRASSRPLYAARAASAASMVLMRAAAKEAMDGNLPRQARLEALRYLSLRLVRVALVVSFAPAGGI
jgi:hypothetical protein